LIARLSYESSPNVQRDSIRNICIALSRDGTYRVLRSKDGNSQRLQGKLTADQFEKIRALLDASDFLGLSGTHGGLIRQESESFGAEIPLPGWQEDKDKSKRLQWLNADGESPFPAPVAKVVEWLKNFQPTNGRRFELAEY